MFSSRNFILTAALLAAAWGAFAADPYPGIGRNATPREVAAWDIDVRPDFKGLPPGSGSVAQGQDVWESRCASCHGIFGESNEVFSPLVGGTTADDVRTGHVAMLKRTDFPGRTTLMKVATVSTLWDYINRAMPWNQPKSLKTDEVYAVLAYLLNMGEIVPADFVLSDRTMAEAQRRLPNRNGMTTGHALWPGKEIPGRPRPDVNAVACMKECPVGDKVASILPDFARNAHGNLAQQNRLVGAQRGADTSRPEPSAAAGGAAPQQATERQAVAAPQPAAAASGGAAAKALLQKAGCIACHAPDRRLVGPGWNEVAAKYPGKADYLAAKIKSGGSGTWGAIPMPPQTLPDPDRQRIAEWLAGGAKP